MWQETTLSRGISPFYSLFRRLLPFPYVRSVRIRKRKPALPSSPLERRRRKKKKTDVSSKGKDSGGRR